MRYGARQILEQVVLLAGFESGSHRVRAAHQGNRVEELEQFRRLELRTEVAGSQRIVIANADLRNAAVALGNRVSTECS